MTRNFEGLSFPDDCSQQPHVNFKFPLPTSLETPRVQLVPIKLDVHGETFFNVYKASPELGQYLPVYFSDYQVFTSFIENFVIPDTGNVILAIIDKTKGDVPLEKRFAGILGLLSCSPSNRTAEIGPVIIFPNYQRTFISSNAIGAALKYLLDIPSQGGLGFRRVTWTANPINEASIRAAERFGFRKEGVLRWTWCLPPEITSGKPCIEERGPALGRDSVLLAICWDDWENGSKEVTEGLIQRVA